jgi:5-hydroxyisourate hydrolase
MKSPITTHVLDTTRGKPAAGVRVVLERRDEAGTWKEIASAMTDADGRAASLLEPHSQTEKGVYRLTFYTADYFGSRGVESFYPYVSVVFEIRERGGHYHVPLLLNPYGYSTYRGS